VLIGAVAPLVLEPLIVPLAMLAGLVVAFGLVYLVEQFVKALFSTAGGLIGRLPWIGSVVSDGVHRIEQRLTGALGSAAHAIDKRMGRYWHQLARNVLWVGDELRAHANLLYTLASFVLGSATTLALRKFIAALSYEIRHARAQLTKLTHLAIVGATAAVKVLSRWTHARIQALAHTVTVVLPHELGLLRGRLRSLEQVLPAALARLRALEARFGELAFAAAVAAVLARLGLGWTRCTKVGRLGNTACGLDDSLLESLLADALLIVGSLSLVEFAESMTEVTELVAVPIRDFWRAG
jgi:hypothetical protein